MLKTSSTLVIKEKKVKMRKKQSTCICQKLCKTMVIGVGQSVAEKGTFIQR